MKLMNRFFTLCLTTALIALASLVGSITASADDPKTFHVKYVPALGEWRTQCLPSWDDSRENGNLSFLLGNAVDGDSVVIHGSDEALSLKITFRQALGNLTVIGSGNGAVIHSEKPIKDLYVIQGGVAAVNCEVENVYIYDDSSCNLNVNMKNVYITGQTKMEMNVAAVGTVEKCVISDVDGTVTTMYNIDEQALLVENGVLRTDYQKYNKEPASAPSAAAPAAPGASTSADPSRPLSPATGEGSGSLLLPAIVLFCLAASLTLKKRKA